MLVPDVVLSAERRDGSSSRVGFAGKEDAAVFAQPLIDQHLRPAKRANLELRTLHEHHLMSRVIRHECIRRESRGLVLQQ